MKVIGTKILIKKTTEKGGHLAEKLGSFVLPDSSNVEDTYEVIAVGSEVDQVKVGDILKTTPWPGYKFEEDGIEYRVIDVKSDDILVILD